jgi:NADPH:quinone reductase-like Zn-dependent oxidoreductase
MTLPTTMTGVYLIGHGGLDQLDYREDIPVPSPKANEVLIRVTAAGMNNTDINTRIGWYSKKVTGSTDIGGSEGFDETDVEDSSWSGGALELPRIQGADVCGVIEAVGSDVDSSRIGERVLVRTMLQTYTDFKPMDCWTIGAEMDGGFAQYTVAPSLESYAIDSDWSDAELASIPCAYSTAENLLHRSNVGAETVLITGASGGVGSAAVQLAKRRGATVIAVSSASKTDQVLAIGADKVVDRNADFVAELGSNSVDVVIDLVAGDKWPSLLEVLKRGGRYAVAGAIAGPIVELDVRTLYLKDLSLLGCTFQDEVVFSNLVSYIEKGEIKPLVSKTYPLSEIAQAQTDFLDKKFTGKLVLIPPAVS